MTGPHDRLFKETFSDPRNAAVELRAVLPAALLAEMDLATLALRSGSFVDDELAATHADLLYTVALAGGRSAYVYVLFEHQSTVDLLMPFRVLVYVVRVLQQHLREHGPTLPLPAVIPVVLHHSEQGWTGATRLRALFDPELLSRAEVAELLPDLRFVLDDISHASDAQLRGRARDTAERIVPVVLWAMRDARNPVRFLATVVDWMRLMAEVLGAPHGRDALAAVLRYLARVGTGIRPEDIVRAAELAAPEVKEAMMTLAEQWIEEGRAKGEAEGRRRLLLRLLTLKFHDVAPEHHARVEAASDEDLDLWAERVLTATSLDEVFAR